MSRSSSSSSLSGALSPSTVPWLLAAGLLLVGAALFATHVPVMVGVGLLMLGSTVSIRHRVPPQLRLLAMSANLVVYLLLYALFLGAVLQPATPWSPMAPAWLRLGDLVGSLWLVILSLQHGIRELQSSP